jgi:hypothetical protein
MPQVALITVHGMGETPRDYAAGVFDQMRTRLGPALRERAAFHSVYYQDTLQKNERTVWERVARGGQLHYERWGACSPTANSIFSPPAPVPVWSRPAAISRFSWLRTRTCRSSRSRRRRRPFTG